MISKIIGTAYTVEMKKTFLLILMAATATGICRAGSYASELKKFFIESGTVYDECCAVCEYYMDYYVAQLNDEGASEDTITVRQARFEAYLDNQLADVMTEVYLPYFQQHMSKEDFGAYFSALNASGVREAEEHINRVQLGLMEDFTVYLQEAVVAVMNDEAVELRDEPDCSEEYRGKFESYMKSSGNDDVFYNEELAQVLEGYGKPEAADVIFKNLRTIALGKYVREISGAEFDAVLTLINSDAYSAYRASVAAAFQDDAFNRILERLCEAVGFDILPE